MIEETECVKGNLRSVTSDRGDAAERDGPGYQRLSLVRCVDLLVLLDHTVAKFHESTSGEFETSQSLPHLSTKDKIADLPLDRDLHIGDVVKNEFDETFVVVLSQEFDE